MPNRGYELAGQRFGKWFVLRRGDQPIPGRGKPWLCRCDCGLEKIVHTQELTRGLSKGCRRCGRRKMFGGMSSTHWNRVLHSAKYRGIPVEITPEYAWTLYQLQNGRCALSGLPIQFLESVRRSKEWGYGNTASLDRINSSKGYTEGNVRWLHKCVNILKRNMLDIDFLAWCKLVYEHNLLGAGDVVPNDYMPSERIYRNYEVKEYKA